MSCEEVICDFLRTNSGPATEIENQTLSELNIDSPKDSFMSDENEFTITVKCQAEASDSEVTKSQAESNNNSTKSIAGSTTDHQEESVDIILSSKTTQVYELEEEEVTAGEEKVDGAGGDDEGEVEIVEEVTSEETRREGRRDRRDDDDKSSEGRGAIRWASTDQHYVKANIEQLQRDSDKLKRYKAREENDRKKARGDREKEMEKKVISAHLAANAAKKADMDNMIRSNISKQYGAQDTLPKQSVVQ